MRILNLLAIFAGSIQILVIVYYLFKYPTDNLPFFVFLIVVPAISVVALATGSKK